MHKPVSGQGGPETRPPAGRPGPRPTLGGPTTVGTGFTDRELRRLESELHPDATDENPFVENVQWLKKGTVFVRPRLVTDVEYTEMTNEGILRHPSYKGLRDDKPAIDVVREEPVVAG